MTNAINVHLKCSYWAIGEANDPLVKIGKQIEDNVTGGVTEFDLSELLGKVEIRIDVGTIERLS